MKNKTKIKVSELSQGAAIFINGKAAYVASVSKEGGSFVIEWYYEHSGEFVFSGRMNEGDEVVCLPDGVKWPSPLYGAEKLLDWQRRGLQYTATGYGTKIPTSKVIKWSDGKVRRVYCDVFGNVGSCYCMILGCKVSVKGFDMISEATK